MKKCPICNSENIDDGNIVTGLAETRSLYRSFQHNITSSGVRVVASVCKDCGHVELSVDVKELEKKIHI